MMPVGHMKFVAGLDVTVWSYASNLDCGFYACREAVPDLWRIAGVEDSMHELVCVTAATCARAA